MKQDLAHLNIDGQIVLVLRRSHKYGVALKLRTSGKPGSLLSDESDYLNDNPETLYKLLCGKTVKL